MRERGRGDLREIIEYYSIVFFPLFSKKVGLLSFSLYYAPFPIRGSKKEVPGLRHSIFTCKVSM
jgi:hypothetical protein